MSNTPVAADLRFMREVNATAVLELLRKQDRMSVTELAQTTGLSRQAVTRSLNDMHSAGLVEFLAPDRNARRSGRPPQLVRFRAHAGYVVGAFIDPDEIRLSLADLRGHIIASTRTVLAQGTTGAEAISLLVHQAKDLLTSAQIPATEVHCAGIGAPGIVDPSAGVIRMVPSMSGLSGDGVVRALGEYLGCPIHLDNDVKFATRGEQWHGVRRDHESLVVVHWGERIGAGILLDGTIYRGATNDAGDLGFLDVLAETDEQPTSSGLGRFEAWAGASALIRLAVTQFRQSGEVESARQILDAGDSALEIVLDHILDGHDGARAALSEVAGRFAIGLAAIRALLDPHLVVFNGPVARAGDLLLDALREALADYPLGLPDLQVSTLGSDAVVLGAIRHCLDDLESSRYAPITKGDRR